MPESIEWLRSFMLAYPFLEYPIVFLGAAFGGELTIITLGFLAAQNVFSTFIFILLSFFGVLSSDILWFFLGRTVFVQRIISHRYATSAISAIHQIMRKMSHGSDLVAFIIAKFLVGTRVLIIMYLSATKIEFRNFVRYDVVAIILWLLVVIPIGFVAGLGFTYLSEVFRNVYAAMGFILLILVLLIGAEIWLKRFFIPPIK